MRDPGGNWRTDIGLRAGGALLCGVAFMAIRVLTHWRAGPAPGAGGYALAAIGFLGASIGMGLLVLGGHLFDAVELSDRWRPRDPLPPRPTPRLPGAAAMENICAGERSPS